MDDALRQRMIATEDNMRAYKLAFGSPAGQVVLVGLAAFCRAAETTAPGFDDTEPIDKDRMLIMEGRRQVFLMIQRKIGLTAAQVFELATGRTVEIATEETEDAA
jgi:hypothetical protein